MSASIITHTEAYTDMFFIKIVNAEKSKSKHEDHEFTNVMTEMCLTFNLRNLPFMNGDSCLHADFFNELLDKYE